MISYGCTHEARVWEFNFTGQRICSECRCRIYKDLWDYNYNFWSINAVQNNKKFFDITKDKKPIMW